MSIQLAENDILHEYWRTLISVARINRLTSGQYVSHMRAIQKAMSGGPSDKAGLISHLLMLSPTTRNAARAAYNHYQLFWTRRFRETLREPYCDYPSEEELAFARTRMVLGAPPADVLRAVKVLARLLNIGTQRVAALTWSEVAFVSDTTGAQFADVSYRRLNRARITVELNLAGAGSLALLRKHATEPKPEYDPEPAWCLLSASTSHLVPPTTGLLTKWMIERKVTDGQWLDQVLAAGASERQVASDTHDARNYPQGVETK
jgi:hypothetical protein